MDSFDYIDEERPLPKIMSFVWNVLTIFALLGVVGVVTVFAFIFDNPDTPLNPFRPQSLPAPMVMPTSTSTPRSVLPPTWTPEPTLPPTDTPVPTLTFTPPPSETPFSLFTPTETTPPEGARGAPFEVAPESPIATSAAAFHSEGCDWLGVAGQVYDLTGAPISGQQVRIGGFLGTRPVDMFTLTGLSGAYNTSGFFEFYLGEVPTATNGSLWVQLLDQAGIAMSDKVFFQTYDTCDKNLILINFKQMR